MAGSRHAPPPRRSRHREQLERALELQRAQPERRLGEILTEQGFVDPGAISRVLAEQHELEFVDLEPRRRSRPRRPPPARAPRAPLPRAADRVPRGRRLARRGRRPDERHVLRRSPPRPRGAGAHRVASPPTRSSARSPRVNDVMSPIEELVTRLRDEDDGRSILDLHHDTPAVVFVNKSISSRSTSAPPTSTSRRSRAAQRARPGRRRHARARLDRRAHRPRS